VRRGVGVRAAGRYVGRAVVVDGHSLHGVFGLVEVGGAMRSEPSRRRMWRWASLQGKSWCHASSEIIGPGRHYSLIRCLRTAHTDDHHRGKARLFANAGPTVIVTWTGPGTFVQSLRRAVGL